MNLIHKFKRDILNFLFPPRCPVCNEITSADDEFCEECKNKINFCEEQYELPSGNKCISVFIYDENIKNAVYRLKDKYGNIPVVFAKYMSEAIIKQGINQKIDMIIPVPMHISDIKKRGYNQSWLISREISNILQINTINDIILKTRKTNAQKTLSKEQRKVNLKDAFTVSDVRKIINKNILLIDDVCTTGSTLSEISDILKKNGANEVFCCTCCHTADIKYRR